MKRRWKISAVIVLALAIGVFVFRVSTVREIGRIEALEGRTGQFDELAKTFPIGFHHIESSPYTTNSLETARTNMGLTSISNLFVVRFRDNGLPAFDGYAAYDTNRQQMVRVVVNRLPNDTRVPEIVRSTVYYAFWGSSIYTFDCIFIAVFWRGMLIWIVRYRAAHTLCVLFVVYSLLGFWFFRTHTTGGSYMVTHARTTATDRLLVSVFRPFCVFWLGFRILEEPVDWDVGYHDMVTAPTASLTSSGFILHLGTVTNASFSGYNMHPDEVPVNTNLVYIYCRMDKRGKHQQEFNVEYSSSFGWKHEPQSVKLMWLDPDGVTVPIHIVK